MTALAAAALLMGLAASSSGSGEAWARETPGAATLGMFGSTLGYGLFPGQITLGPDGNLWFVGTSSLGQQVGRVTPAGEVTEFTVAKRGPRGGAIVAGPDGALWFTRADGIGRITTAGEASAFPVGSAEGRPTSLAFGREGDVWFTEPRAGRIGRLAPGGEATFFALPAGRRPSAIAAGPDGRLWFTERGANFIGAVSPAGRTVEYPVPGPPAKLNSILLGADGNLWFGESGRPAIGRITPRGRVRQFPLPVEGETRVLALGPDGRIWFATGAEVGAIAPDGAFTWPACVVVRCLAGASALAFGSEGRLWVGLGTGHCATLCGGGSEIAFNTYPGHLGTWEPPPLTLAIGPRLSPLRGGRTGVLLACGPAASCRGLVRFGYVYHEDGKREFEALAGSRYSLAPGTSRRIPLQIPRGTLDEYRGETFYPQAEAGPPGTVVAARPFEFTVPSRPRR